MKLLSLLNEELAYETNMVEDPFSSGKIEVTTIYSVIDGKKEQSPVEIHFQEHKKGIYYLTFPNTKKRFGERYKPKSLGDKFWIVGAFNRLHLLLINNKDTIPDSIKRLLVNIIEYYQDSDTALPEDLKDLIKTQIQLLLDSYMDIKKGNSINREKLIEEVKKVINIFKEYQNEKSEKEPSPFAHNERGFIKIALKLIDKKLAEGPNVKINYCPSSNELEQTYMRVLKKFGYKLTKRSGNTYTIQNKEKQ